MITTPSLRQIFSDKESLQEYGEGRLPSWGDIKRRLFLCERSLDTRLPDHYYKRGQEKAMGHIDSLAALLTGGMHHLAAQHLGLTGNRIHVQADAWPAWQELLTFCPPLPLMCGYIWKDKFRPGTHNPEELADFARQWLEPNTRYTCLPSPHYPNLHKLVRDSGLCDLHVHLTGSTETDSAWQSYLQNPFSFYREVSKKVEQQKDEKVREQLEQEIHGFENSLIFYEWLTTAQVLRRAFVHLLFKGAYTPEFADVVNVISTPAMLHRRNIAGQMIPPSLIHPMRRVFQAAPDDTGNWSDVTLEGLMYLLLMDQLDRTKDEKLAACFHYYLLILGFFNRFTVQQVHQCGFDQFQKITLNEFRTTSEQEYSRRFKQMHGNDGHNLAFVEGRFAPKDTVLKTIRLLTDIDKGWKKFRTQYQGNQRRHPAPRLRLVCHFIKEADKQKLDEMPVRAIRHRTLRIANMRKARSLLLAREQYPGMKQLVTGVDAANNELETPPEVFAPVYRYLRRSGFIHFTFHAGEDFHHLIGGLRTMFEAVEFLDLRRGDRIGHGTAAGIDPQLWLDHVGDNLVMSRGEWLDDLLFVIHLLEQYPGATSSCAARLPTIRAKAIELSQQIYGKHYSGHSHIQAWLLRKYCPFHLLNELDDAMRQPLWCAEEWRLANRDEQDCEALELLEKYHRADCRRKYHEKISVKTTGFLTVDELAELQETVLAYLHHCEIVLETLPTSNVRISFYKDHSQHHLWRWLGVKKDSECRNKNTQPFSSFPPVVVGTDDTGIFSTNIANEFNHIYYHLIQTHNMPYSEAAGKVRELIENARVYGFVG